MRRSVRPRLSHPAAESCNWCRAHRSFTLASVSTSGIRPPLRVPPRTDSGRRASVLNRSDSTRLDSIRSDPTGREGLQKRRLAATDLRLPPRVAPRHPGAGRTIAPRPRSRSAWSGGSPGTTRASSARPSRPRPTRSSRAFPRLEVKQPLALAPEPGTDRLFILQHLESWAGPGRLLAVRGRPGGDRGREPARDRRPRLGLAFHPDYEQNGYLYIGLNGPMRGPGQEDPGRPLHGRSPAAPPDRPGLEAPDHRVALRTATTAATSPSATTATSTSPRATAPATPTPT